MTVHPRTRPLGRKLFWGAIIPLVMGLGWSCTDDPSSTGSDDDGSGGPNDLAGGANAAIVARVGGSLTTAGGITLTIDPGAEDPEYETITGTITGGFDAKIDGATSSSMRLNIEEWRTDRPARRYPTMA